EGKIYSLLVNETQLDQPRSYTVQLALRKVSRCLPHLAVRAMTSNQSSAAFLTDKGAVYFEVHTPGVYRDLFGTLHAFDPLDLQMPLALALPAKVLSCALGYNHLGLLDEFGRLFMQGSNRFGQLGTGDKIDRGEPTLVHELKCPLDIWCGLKPLAGPAAEPGAGPGRAGLRLRGRGAAARLAQGQRHLRQAAGQGPALRQQPVLHPRVSLPAVQPRHRGGAGVPRAAPQPGAPPLESPGAQACEQYLSQLQGCPTLAGRLAKVKEAVGALPLPPCQKDFLWEALELIRRSARPRSPPPAASPGSRPRPAPANGAPKFPPIMDHD
ncbi:unnamed protein product, partial [Natator depressus]